MKRIFTLLSCAAALLMAGCTNDIDEGINQPSEGAPSINIDGSIHQTYTTRVDDGGFRGGDQVGLFGVNYTEGNTVAGELLDKGNQVDNARYTYDEANRVWNAQGNVYYKDAHTNIDIYAYYPYSGVESTTAHKFEVLADQSGGGVIDGHSMSDFLWGKVEKVEPSSQRVRIKFSHKMAATKVSLIMGDNWSSESEWESTKKGVLQLNVIRTAEVDLSTGEVRATGEPTSEGTLMKSTAEGFRAITVPQTVAAGTALFSIDIDGMSYRYKDAADFTWEGGKMHSFTIKVNKKPSTGTYELVLADCEIVDWVADLGEHGDEARQYYVVHMEESGTLGAKLREAGKDPNKIKNLKISGLIDASDFYFMRDNMEILQAVNLKESKIVAIQWHYFISIEGGPNYFYEYFATAYPTTDEEAQAQVQARYPEATITFHHYGTISEYPADEIPADAFSGKQSLVYFVFPERVTRIGDSAFSNTMLSGALVIPDDVEEIRNGAFLGTLITSLDLPYKLKSIGSSAFQECSILGGTLQLPDSLESLGSSAFNGCSSLTGELKLPHGLKEIPSYCFRGCNNLSGNIVIPEGVEKIGDCAFYFCDNIKGSLTLPATLKEIDVYAFCNTPLQGELVIPEGVTRIGGWAFLSCDFSSIVLPEGLLRIDDSAFGNNVRLCEPIVFPTTLQSIGKSAFSDCRQIPSIDLPEDITTIQNNAFSGCYGISSIISRAKTPPTVMSGAFDGVAKDNFTLEVPESAVVKYQTATGWNEFQRIAAHHDFSFSRRLFRTLNAGGTKSELILRAPAGLRWRVESKPEWVEVSHLSGVGKTDDIVVTVRPMDDSEVETFEVESYSPNYSSTVTSTHAGRKGEIVFLLEDKEYRSTMVVEQYDYEYADGDVITNQTATEGHGVDLVFLGDCFDAKDISEGKYVEGVKEAIEHFFAIEPYKTYRNYFNVYTVLGLSPDSGVGTVNTIKEAKFGTQYTLNAGLVIEEGLDNIFDYTTKAIGRKGQIKNTLITLILNTTQYGGLTFMWGDGTAVALCPMSEDAYPYDFRGLVQHEAGGHGFAKLADEYIYHNMFIQTCGCICCNHLDAFRMGKNYGWYNNLSESGNMDSVPWSHLIFHNKYANIVDIYEGGYFHTRGIYRSEPTSCMNNNIPYFSAISRQTIVEKIMKLANKKFSLDDFYAKDVLDASNNTRALAVDENAPAVMNGASKQMPPVFMGESPNYNASNK